MPNTIHKYPLQLQEFQTVKLPAFAKIRKAGYDAAGQLCLWAQVTQGLAPTEDVGIYITGTGRDIPAHVNYIDTVFDQQFVSHIWSQM